MEETKVGSSEELGFVETLKLTFTYWARKLPYFMLPYLLFSLISILIIFGILAAVGFDLGFLICHKITNPCLCVFFFHQLQLV
jgi:hypothetical protein